MNVLNRLMELAEFKAMNPLLTPNKAFQACAIHNNWMIIQKARDEKQNSIDSFGLEGLKKMTLDEAILDTYEAEVELLNPSIN